MNPIGITGYGYYDATAIAGSKDRIDNPPSIDEIKWKNASEEPFKRFGQLDALSKSVLIATEMIGIENILNDELKIDTAIVLGTQEGCLGTDIDFYASALEREIANPRLFAYTLPSTVFGDVAIRYRLQGPNACFLNQGRSGILALEESYHLVASGEVDACLCIGADALFAQSAETASKHEMLQQDYTHSAHAFMLTRKSATPAPLLCEFTTADDADHTLNPASTLKNLCDWLEASKNCIPTIQIS